MLGRLHERRGAALAQPIMGSAVSTIFLGLSLISFCM
jgi:hypothetical protein